MLRLTIISGSLSLDTWQPLDMRVLPWGCAYISISNNMFQQAMDSDIPINWLTELPYIMQSESIRAFLFSSFHSFVYTVYTICIELLCMGVQGYQRPPADDGIRQRRLFILCWTWISSGMSSSTVNCFKSHSSFWTFDFVSNPWLFYLYFFKSKEMSLN